jgi:hypothetical protein
MQGSRDSEKRSPGWSLEGDDHGTKNAIFTVLISFGLGGGGGGRGAI